MKTIFRTLVTGLSILTFSVASFANSANTPIASLGQQILSSSPDAHLGADELARLANSLDSAEALKAFMSLPVTQQQALLIEARGLAARLATNGEISTTELLIASQAGQKTASATTVVVSVVAVGIGIYLVVGFVACSIGASIASMGGGASWSSILRCMHLPRITID